MQRKECKPNIFLRQNENKFHVSTVCLCGVQIGYVSALCMWEVLAVLAQIPPIKLRVCNQMNRKNVFEWTVWWHILEAHRRLFTKTWEALSKSSLKGEHSSFSFVHSLFLLLGSSNAMNIHTQPCAASQSEWHIDVGRAHANILSSHTPVTVSCSSLLSST